MSAGLQDFDWMMSVREKPWHGIGTIIEDAPNSDEAIKIAKLDWKVVQYPVSANGMEIPETYCNMRSDANIPLGIVKERYKILQNDEAFAFVDDIVKSQNVECKYETAGSLYNGRRVFMVVKLPNHVIMDDDVENYLFFTNSHDGTSRLTAGVSSVRVVCNNTLQLAIRNAKMNNRIWYCRHTASIKERQAEAVHSLGFAVNYVAKSKEVAEELFTVKVNKDDFYANLKNSKAFQHSSSKNKDKVIERIDAIYENTDNLANFKGTGWGMYNAVADYVSNAKPIKNTKSFDDRKLSFFFDGYQLLDSSQEILMAA